MKKNNLKYSEYDVNYISGCMSLRPPQSRSLKILDSILEEIELKKDMDLESALETVHDLYPTCTNFERKFMSLTFALATGVGKTRLMGAFITYLYTVKGIKNFFVVAPNLTIYNKLKSDLSDINSPKYVFKGVGCFAGVQPHMIYGDNYKQDGFTCGYSDCTINVFNIDKFNKEVGEMKHLSEFIGKSYFKYLAGLDDLVVLMDESHHYRQDRGMAALNELNPVLGLELTATPQVETGSKSVKFKNVVYEFPLSKAIEKGYTKTPYALSRKDIADLRFGDDEMDKMMLSDGILQHERVKTALENYANNNPEVRRVKPFMLVVCMDTNHAEKVKEFITSSDFENGKYKNKTIILHSNQKGIEKEENIQLLNAVEQYDNPIEIVIHVNILKEGWDVNNLYTIVPLRTAASKTLREQTIGRGLRLPYGTRTGDIVVDSLAIAAHNKFEEIIKEALDKNSMFKAGNIIYADEIEKNVPVVAPANVRLNLQTRLEECFTDLGNNGGLSQEEKECLTTTAKAVNSVLTDAFRLYGRGSLGKSITTQEVVDKVLENEDLAEIVKKRTDFSDIIRRFAGEETEKQREIIVKQTMAIPRIAVKSDGKSNYRFERFNLDLTDMNYVPISNEIQMQNLITNEALTFEAKGLDFQALNPMAVLGYELKAKPEVRDEYDDLLYNLITEFFDHLSKRYNNDEIRNIVMFYKRDIANKIYKQMKEHFTLSEPNFIEQVVGVTYDPIDPGYIKKEGEEAITLNEPVEDKDVPTKLFIGFKRALHTQYKFDSSPERRFAVVCENDKEIEKWLRPAPTQFQLYYNGIHRYIPDFVVETKDTMYLVEIKGEDKLKDPDVIAKRDRAVSYCRVVNIYADGHGMKKWKHLFIPGKQVSITSSFSALAKQFEVDKLSEE